MPLTNGQYDELLRSYDLKRQYAREALEERRSEIYRAVPALREVDQEIAKAGIRAAKSRILGSGYDPSSLREELSALSKKRAEMLQSAGFSPDALEMRYECPYCRDTGFVDGQKCRCFLDAQSRLLYDRYRLGNILKKENFAHFSFDWYSDTITDEKTGLSERQYAQIAYDRARYTAGHIGESGSSLFLYGRTGVGKTFLTHCIAKEALDRGMTALYFTAGEFVSLMENTVFGRREDSSFSDRMVLTCDLLIIDDLGTELTNAFVSSRLFRCVNERILADRTTVISTNLSLEEFRETYSERVFSRIASQYSIVKLVGDDIRLRKKRT
ncbi:MAG: ATP-binding protein [Lachnospiraceae bacterium]|nr:ATP-binding protein [Lachnospiraceae bacterium]